MPLTTTTLALSPLAGLAVIGAFAVGEPDACRLADLAARNASNERIQRWAASVRSVAAQRAQDADRVECAGCGDHVPCAASRPCGTDRACESCAAHLCAACGCGLADGLVGYTDVCNDCAPAPPPSHDGGLRPGAAALLGLCEECGETDDCDCDCDDGDDAAELAADRVLERQELSALDDCDGFADAGDWS
ncbi:MAG: hypothetical protein IT374_26100 [Polyangiaceae bacterium]|nr:hypothetical protein [Polyangiaceae bacterium]